MGGKPRPTLGIDVNGDGQLNYWKGCPVRRRSGYPRRVILHRDPDQVERVPNCFPGVCQVCRLPYAMWMTDWSIWIELPRELWHACLCVKCFKFLVKLTRRYYQIEAKEVA